MKDKTLFTYKGLSAVLSEGKDSKIVDLLSNTVLGSKGGMRYLLMSISERIAAYSNIRFVSLFKGSRLVGTIGLCYRKVHQGNLVVHGTYLRYLSVMMGYQSADDVKYTREKKLTEGDPAQSDSMKGMILSFIRKPESLGFPGYEKGDKSVVYAYVESMNERSKNMIHQAGFNYIRSFLTVAFSRYSPAKDERVKKLPEAEREKMLGLLGEYYSGYSLYNDENTFFQDRYYVIREGDEIVAGLSAVPTSYNVVDVPGVWGWVFMNVLHRLPYYRRLFQPGVFRFLVFGSIFMKSGHEEDLEALMESVCAEEGINTALTWVDDRSELFELLRTGINMGALNRMLNAKPGLVYANFINLSESDRELFYDNPAFISGFDFT